MPSSIPNFSFSAFQPDYRLSTTFETAGGVLPEEISGRVEQRHCSGIEEPIEPHESPPPVSSPSPLDVGCSMLDVGCSVPPPLSTIDSPDHQLPSAIGLRTSDLDSAQSLAILFDRFHDLTTRDHMTVTGAARVLGKSASLFSGPNSLLARYRRGGLAALAVGGRASQRAQAPCSDLTSQIESLPWFLPAANWFYLNTNATADRGSLPEAVRCTISLPDLPTGWTNPMRARFALAIGYQLSAIPTCPADLRESILARQSASRPLVPPRIAKQIILPPGIVRLHRNPRNWSLDTLSAPGSQRRYYNADTARREIMQPGDWFGGDDATPGIAVCVPCTEVITPVSQRYGVLIGRFQWLAYDDCRTDTLLAWDYVVRPRGSYRAEDVVNGIGAVTRAHGIPRKGYQLEGGTFNATLVRHCLKLLGCEHWRTYSPHQKAIESIFNRVWTRLSIQFPHADMGRRRGENQSNCALYEACKRGQKDPRSYFPSLPLVLSVFEEEVAAHNSRRIHSEQYGQWVPQDFFAQSVQEHKLRQFSPDMDWIFSPFSVERKIRGMMVRCRVPMFEDFSVPFEFHAEWMPLHDGKKVRLHFNPRDPQATAKIVLLERSGQSNPDDILGDAKLIGETSGHIRMVMGWAQDDQRAGYIARQRTNNFMRRETRAVTGTATAATPYSATEHRDGLGQVTKIERTAPLPTDPAVLSPINPILPIPENNLPSRLERADQWEKDHALAFL